MEPPATPRKPRSKSTDTPEDEASKSSEPKGTTRKSTASGDAAKPKSTTAKKPAAKTTKPLASPTASSAATASASEDVPAVPKGIATPPPAPVSRPPTPAPKPAAASTTPSTPRTEGEPDIFTPMPASVNKPSGAPMPQRPIIPDNVREGITQGAARLSRRAQDGIVQIRKAVKENSGPLAKSAQGAGNSLVDLLRKLILGLIDGSRRVINALSSPLATVRDEIGKAVKRLEENVRKDDTAVIVTTLLTIAACVILTVAVVAITRGR